MKLGGSSQTWFGRCDIALAPYPARLCVVDWLSRTVRRWVAWRVCRSLAERDEAKEAPKDVAKRVYVLLPAHKQKVVEYMHYGKNRILQESKEYVALWLFVRSFARSLVRSCLLYTSPSPRDRG